LIFRILASRLCVLSVVASRTFGVFWRSSFSKPANDNDKVNEQAFPSFGIFCYDVHKTAVKSGRFDIVYSFVVGRKKRREGIGESHYSGV